MPTLKIPPNLRLALPWILLICLGIAAFQLWQDQQALQKKLASNQQDLAQISALSIEYQHLGGAKSTQQHQFSQASEAMTWLISSSKEQGIETTVSLFDAVNDGQQKDQSITSQINVTFEQAHFNRLIQWLQQYDTTNLTLLSSELSVADVGKVKGFFRLEVN